MADRPMFEVVGAAVYDAATDQLRPATARNVVGMTQAQASDSKTAVITIRVPQAVYRRILAVVEVEGITLADWTRDAMLNAVRRAERQQRSANP